jgi:phage shock protein PspC (stress-responsive transcriptional regulator)
VAGGLRCARCGRPEKQLSAGVDEGRSALWASGKRQIIEGVIGQLKDFFGLERHRAKTLGGLLTRLAAKVVAYTCAQRINDSLGRPLRHLADLLI